MLRALLVSLLCWPLFAAAEPLPQRLVEAGYAQVGVTLGYDPSYRRIPFPGGDVPESTGVCSDVVIRAYRAVGIDLQALVNQDMRKDFLAYPRIWHMAHPDPNIDHRRVPNLATFFRRHGQSLPVTAEPRDYRPGDVVTWQLSGGLAHIGLVADRYENGNPLMIHNIGEGVRVEDVLFAFTITGHFRYRPGEATAQPFQ
jgi:uncharacterized protein YijF (DUF1287 family)